MRDAYERKIEEGAVNPGWTPQAWAEYLRYRAAACDERHQQVAADYRSWADNVAARHVARPPVITDADLEFYARLVI